MNWFYACEGQSLGPVNDAELARLVSSGRIDGSTLVWNSDLPDWRPYAQVGPVPGAAAPPATLPLSGAAPPHFPSIVGTALPYAGFWVRVAASLCDSLVMLPVIALVFLAFFWAVPDFLSTPTPWGSQDNRAHMFFQFWRMGSTMNLTPSGSGGIARMLYQLAAFVIGVSYETVCVGRWGATPGKMICNLRVVRPDGARVSYSRAFGRYFGKVLSSLFFDIGYIIAGFDSQKRGLHDYICSTRVIHMRRNKDPWSANY